MGRDRVGLDLKSKFHTNSVSSKTFHRFSSVELLDAIESIGTDDITSQPQITSEPVTESSDKISVEQSVNHVIEPSVEHVTEPSVEHVTDAVTGMTRGISFLFNSDNCKL